VGESGWEWEWEWEWTAIRVLSGPHQQKAETKAAEEGRKCPPSVRLIRKAASDKKALKERQK